MSYPLRTDLGCITVQNGQYFQIGPMSRPSKPRPIRDRPQSRRGQQHKTLTALQIEAETKRSCQLSLQVLHYYIITFDYST